MLILWGSFESSLQVYTRIGTVFFWFVSNFKPQTQSRIYNHNITSETTFRGCNTWVTWFRFIATTDYWSSFLIFHNLAHYPVFYWQAQLSQLLKKNDLNASMDLGLRTAIAGTTDSRKSQFKVPVNRNSFCFDVPYKTAYRNSRGPANNWCYVRARKRDSKVQKRLNCSHNLSSSLPSLFCKHCEVIYWFAYSELDLDTDEEIYLEALNVSKL